jgi:hypothetical protein
MLWTIFRPGFTSPNLQALMPASPESKKNLSTAYKEEMSLPVDEEDPIGILNLIMKKLLLAKY